MNCTEVERQLDDYLDHSCGARASSDLDHLTAADIAAHMHGCTRCQAELERRHALLDDLRALPVPVPSPDFLETSVRAAKAAGNAGGPSHGRRRTDAGRRSTVLTGLAAAVLAAVMLGTVLLAPGKGTAPDTGLPSISLTTGTVTPVKLAFSSETALEHARLSLSLPVGIELMGYDGRSDISWNTDLKPGTNVLRLPLVGRSAGSNFLVARLDHPNGSKVFRLQVTVTDSGATDND
ncbi:MAG: hypothetical protein P8Y69_03175 [Gammaproteobacteria bacterium]